LSARTTGHTVLGSVFPVNLSYSFFVIVLYGGSGICSQGFALARQVSCHWSHTSSPFCSLKLFAGAILKTQSLPPASHQSCIQCFKQDDGFDGRAMYWTGARSCETVDSELDLESFKLQPYRDLME
jgi:hypothetical protein